MTVEVDEARLDDPAALRAADPGGMLRAVASSGAQVREAVTLAAEAGLERLAAEGRPRAFVVAGMGGSAIAGDVLAAVAGTGCPVPVLVHRGYGLPGWVGPADLVAGVSCSGGTEETLSALDEAQRRGCRLLAVGAAGSPLEQRAERARAPFVPAPLGRQPRASVWALSTPLVLAGSALGLLHAPPAALEATATRLDEISAICRPDSDAFVNPAKALALELRETLPLVWGGSPLAGVAAYRFSCQL
ncbi:MAG: SIS domain-containing protein, partial [Mycobacterium leprae]